MGGTGAPGRRIGDQGVHRFAAVGGERGDVHQRRHLRMGAGLGDDGAAVRMPDQHRLVGLPVERAPGDGRVVGERERRVLHDGHGVAGLPQDLVDGLPAGAVDETAMDEDDAGHDPSPSTPLPSLADVLRGDSHARPTTRVDELHRSASS